MQHLNYYVIEIKLNNNRSVLYLSLHEVKCTTIINFDKEYMLSEKPKRLPYLHGDELDVSLFVLTVPVLDNNGLSVSNGIINRNLVIDTKNSHKMETT